MLELFAKRANTDSGGTYRVRVRSHSSSSMRPLSERPSLDERLDRRLESMQQHLAVFRTVVEATKKLYGQLTAEQQAAAEDLLSRRHGRRLRF